MNYTGYLMNYTGYLVNIEKANLSGFIGISGVDGTIEVSLNAYGNNSDSSSHIRTLWEFYVEAYIQLVTVCVYSFWPSRSTACYQLKRPSKLLVCLSEIYGHILFDRFEQLQ